MKKLAFITAIMLMALSLFSCSTAQSESADSTLPVSSPQGFEDVTAPPEEETTEKAEKETTAEETTAPAKAVTTTDEAIAKAKEFLGEVDSYTGYAYSFSYDGMLEDNSVEYFKIRVYWHIAEQERYAYCGDLLVSPDGEVTEYNW